MNRPAPNTYYRNTRAEVAQFLPSRYQRVLEVGCGEGSFREQLTSPCEYWGVEPMADAAQVAASRLDRVIQASFDQAATELPDGYFDLVVCNDVIEHMVDHDAFLDTLRTKTAPGACIVGSIPNVRHVENLMDLMLHRDWHYSDEGTLDRTHLRFFTARSLKRTFAEHGCAVEAFGGLRAMKPRPYPPTRLWKNLLILWWGADTRYKQFGFRVRWAEGQA